MVAEASGAIWCFIILLEEPRDRAMSPPLTGQTSKIVIATVQSDYKNETSPLHLTKPLRSIRLSLPVPLSWALHELNSL